MTTIIPSRPGKPIVVETEAGPNISVASGPARIVAWGTIAGDVRNQTDVQRAITVGTTPPASPQIGDLWLDTN